jgi:hypothetical protein
MMEMMNDDRRTVMAVEDFQDCRQMLTQWLSTCGLE